MKNSILLLWYFHCFYCKWEWTYFLSVYCLFNFTFVSCLFLYLSIFLLNCLSSLWFLRTIYMLRNSGLCHISYKYFSLYVFWFISIFLMYRSFLFSSWIYQSFLYGFWFLCFVEKTFLFQDYGKNSYFCLFLNLIFVFKSQIYFTGFYYE